MRVIQKTTEEEKFCLNFECVKKMQLVTLKNRKKSYDGTKVPGGWICSSEEQINSAMYKENKVLGKRWKWCWGEEATMVYNMKRTLSRLRFYNVLHTKIIQFTSLTLNLTWLIQAYLQLCPFFFNLQYMLSFCEFIISSI